MLGLIFPVTSVSNALNLDISDIRDTWGKRQPTTLRPCTPRDLGFHRSRAQRAQRQQQLQESPPLPYHCAPADWPEASHRSAGNESRGAIPHRPYLHPRHYARATTV